ncbi:hypothetical protein OPU71_05390 [Niveibacterium sp. 24ML]|uniref:hypothetical protein n=1 Tax=Niveibacterium sp. 24ML TaxID=2985512 RepID=UPI00226E4BAC|nr:hypothetical protein [Niveibacterium sp. 24ML]MCX9155555.1 hypothetical protein [Niveibacterium sp. 24ML]
MNKKMLLAAVAACFCSLSAQADEGRSVYFALTGGLTFGGDEIATIEYTNGTSTELRAGNLVNIGAGLLWAPADMPMSVQATLNYHVDDASADNGHASFSRVPVEVMGYYNGVSKWRFGAGLRFVNSVSAEFKRDGLATETIEFSNALGYVFEAGYRFAKQGWVNGRVGIEEYEPETLKVGSLRYDLSNENKVKANYGGVNIVWGF